MGAAALAPTCAIMFSTIYFNSLTFSRNSIHVTKDKAVTIRNIAWISNTTWTFLNGNDWHFLHEVLATLSVNWCDTATLGSFVVFDLGVWCGLWSPIFMLLGSTLPFIVNIYLTWWLKSYCSFQCDVGCSLECSNTENLTVLTNRAGNSYIGRNTSCNLFCNNQSLQFEHDSVLTLCRL